MSIDDLEKKTDEMQEALIVMKNIQEGSKIDRFRFTEKETLAVSFTIELLAQFLNEINPKLK
jgi:hypothetical protein